MVNRPCCSLAAAVLFAALTSSLALLPARGLAQLPGSLTNGLVSYYDFSGNANDIAGTNNASVVGATLTNGVTGAPETAYHFNGASDYLLANYTPTPNNAFTWSVWVKPNAAGEMWILSNIQDLSVGSFSPVILFRNGVPGSVTFYTANGYVKDEFASASNVPADLWTMLTFTSDANNERFIYLNGQLNASGYSTNGYGQPLNKLLIGGAAVIEAPNQFYFDGSLDDVTIYDRPLSSTEVSELYQAQLVPEPSTYALLLMTGAGALWWARRRH